MNQDSRMHGDWQAYLHALPQAEPPAALRARVLAAPQRQGALRAPLWALAAATLAAAVVLVPLLREAQAPGAAGDVSTDVAAAQALERRVLDSAHGQDPRLRASMVEIDRALGAAYRRNAGNEEIDALWRARVHALERGLTAAPAEPARI